VILDIPKREVESKLINVSWTYVLI